MKTYHIGLIKGSGNCYPLHYNGHKKVTLIVQGRRCIDYLSCDLWKYLGEHIITKKELKERSSQILSEVNEKNNTSFTHLIID